MATSTVEVFVKLQSGRAISSTFGSHDTVAEITSFVAREEGGVPDQRVRLKYQGKVLDPRKTIGYLGIRPETILRGEVSKRFYLFACWVIFHAICRLLIFFFKSTFSKNYFRNATRVSNSLDQDQAQNYLQRLSADDTS